MLPCHKRKWGLINTTFSSWSCAGSDWSLHCPSGVFKNSQNNLLHNFTSHWSEADRSVVFRVILLAFLENWDNVSQISVYWDLSKVPKPFKNWETLQWHQTALLEYSWMNLIKPQRLKRDPADPAQIQGPVGVNHSHSPGPPAQDTGTSMPHNPLKREAKKALTSLTCLCPRWWGDDLYTVGEGQCLFCTAFRYSCIMKPTLFLLCPQFWRPSTPVEIWPHECSPYSREHHLPWPLFLLH